MNLLNDFFETEIQNKDMYDEIFLFVSSVHIRVGEFEGNEYVIKKMDQTNLIIYAEYVYNEVHEIHNAFSIYKNNFLHEIENYAVARGLVLSEPVQ